MWDILFFANSLLLGVALAMDAFSVSIANGLNEPLMKKGRMSFIAGVYAFFQFAMPMLGWVFVHFLVEAFAILEKFIPYIALLLLVFLGTKMIVECIKENKEAEGSEQEVSHKKLTFSLLMVQGVATAIDALSVGFTIEQYNWLMALVCSLIIAIETFAICMVGLVLGKTVGKKFSYAGVLGGVILICIGLEIFIKSLL